MTDKSEPKIYHARRDGLSVPPAAGHHRSASNRILSRGDEVVIDSAFIEGVRDRNGFSWAEHLKHDEQEARWSEIRFVEGIASETDPEFFSALVAEREVLAAADEQERRLQAHRYGRRYKLAVDDAIAAAKAERNA